MHGWYHTMTSGKELTCRRHSAETNTNTTNYYLFIMEISPSFSFIPLCFCLAVLTSSFSIPHLSPLALVYWRKNGVDSEKQLPVIYLSLSPADNKFQVKGEIIIFSLTKSKPWAGLASRTICGTPHGIKTIPCNTCRALQKYSYPLNIFTISC